MGFDVVVSKSELENAEVGFDVASLNCVGESVGKKRPDEVGVAVEGDTVTLPMSSGVGLCSSALE